MNILRPSGSFDEMQFTFQTPMGRKAARLCTLPTLLLICNGGNKIHSWVAITCRHISMESDINNVFLWVLQRMRFLKYELSHFRKHRGCLKLVKKTCSYGCKLYKKYYVTLKGWKLQSARRIKSYFLNHWEFSVKALITKRIIKIPVPPIFCSREILYYI